MKLDDVLAMAGEHQLSGFDWGASVVILYNGLVPTENHIDVSHTGKLAYEKLRRLPAATLLAVLTREVQIVGSSVDFIGTVGERALGIPPTVPNGHRRLSPMAIFLMIFMSVISLTFLIGAIRSPGQPPNTEALQTVLTTITDMMKEENRAEEAARDEKKEEPPADAPAP
jgi:hypothetical protein